MKVSVFWYAASSVLFMYGIVDRGEIRLLLAAAVLALWAILFTLWERKP